MRYAKVTETGDVVRGPESPPKVLKVNGTLYTSTPNDESLALAGWYPVEEVYPEYSPSTEMLQLPPGNCSFDGSKVVCTYVAVSLPPPIVEYTVIQLHNHNGGLPFSVDGDEIQLYGDTITPDIHGDINNLVAYVTVKVRSVGSGGYLEVRETPLGTTDTNVLLRIDFEDTASHPEVDPDGWVYLDVHSEGHPRSGRNDFEIVAGKGGSTSLEFKHLSMGAVKAVVVG